MRLQSLLLELEAAQRPIVLFFEAPEAMNPAFDKLLLSVCLVLDEEKACDNGAISSKH